MGIFDSLLGLNTNKALSGATGAANGLVNSTTGVTNGLLQTGAANARTDLSNGTNSALASLLAGYTGAKGDVTNYSGQAQDALTGGVNQAASTVQGSNALFQPYASAGTAANGMLSNALGLNGSAGNAAATSAFQTSPGYQFQVDQATDAAARKAASLGMAASGNTLSTIATLGGHLADQGYSSWLDRLQGLGSQGLSAAGAMSGNNATAAGYQYGGASQLASLLNGTGTVLGSLDTGLGAGQATLQSGLGSGLATIDSGLGNALTNNAWRATGMVNQNNLTNAQEQDRTDSGNNGIFSSLLRSAGSSLLPGLKL